ncbi:NAD-dependent epimerase/dehydratase family protein [Phaeovulum vinaykumarii]|uniref:NAD-dependent epimerase/dehydratase family protein n=1 Tax=Phaeovulum vinaykumarii TaxID=407234 RepID=UPI000A064DA3|nr:NAD(P)-dependent oxidoreductase [Phaeovulum vinaykumarii]
MPTWLLVGATGRLGGMVRTAWADSPPPARLLWQRRTRPSPPPSDPLPSDPPPSDPLAADPAWLDWSPLGDIAPLLERLAIEGPVRAMIVLAGAAPRPEAPMPDHTDLALACLEAARRAGIGRVLIASSAAVYGAPSPPAGFAETAPLTPVNAYGAMKARMEEALRQAARSPGAPELCLLRIGNVAGADALLAPHLAALRAGRAARAGLDIFADGRGPLRSYIGPRTLAQVLAALAAAPAPLPDALNIAAPAPVHMDALAAAAGLEIAPRPAPATAQARITLDTTRLERLFSLAPAASLPQSMTRELGIIPRSAPRPAAKST